MAKVEVVADSHSKLGENPLWDDRAQTLYWEDIDEGKLYRYRPKSGRPECFFSGDVIGGFTFQEDGSLLLFETDRIALLSPDGTRRVLKSGIDPDNMERFNDVMADPEGRVYAGTIGKDRQRGGLYRVDCDGSITPLHKGTGCSNGMGFTPDLSHMYWTCSTRATIFRYDWDRATGALSNETIFYSAPKGEGTPDGMCVDTQGNVWSARWGGSSIVKISPEGKLLDRIELPALRVTSATFGGPELDELYLTSAGAHGPASPSGHDGAVFRIRGSGARGSVEFRSRIRT